MHRSNWFFSLSMKIWGYYSDRKYEWIHKRLGNLSFSLNALYNRLLYTDFSLVRTHNECCSINRVKSLFCMLVLFKLKCKAETIHPITCFEMFLRKWTPLSGVSRLCAYDFCMNDRSLLVWKPVVITYRLRVRVYVLASASHCNIPMRTKWVESEIKCIW